MQFSGVQVFAWIVLLVGTGILVSSLASEYWSIHIPKHSHDNLQMHRGVLKQCIITRSYSNCNFRLSSLFRKFRNFLEGYDLYSERIMVYRHLPTQSFEVIVTTLLMFSISMACLIIVFGPFCCKQCKIPTTFIVLLIGLCTGSACFLYWYANNEGRTYTLQQTTYHDVFTYEYGSESNVLSWSFFMAVISACMFFLSSILLCVSSRVDLDIEYLGDTISHV